MALGTDGLSVWVGAEEYVVTAMSQAGIDLGNQTELRLLPTDARSVLNAAFASGTGSLRAFLMDHDLLGVPLVQVTDEQLRALLYEAIEDGRLVVAARDAVSDEGSDNRDARLVETRLVQDLERELRGPLVLDGNSYQLVVRSIRPRDGGFGGDGFQVVPRREAALVLSRIASRPGASPRLRVVSDAAAARLAAHTAPPLAPEGLVLLRRMSQSSFVRESTEPAFTPSMLRRTLEPTEVLNDFLARFIDELGKPIGGLSVLFDIPAGPTPKATGGDGVARVNEVPDTFASAVLADTDAARNLLKPRWDAVRGPATVAASEDVLVWKLGEQEDLDLELQPDKVRTVSLRPFVVQARLFGGLFDTSKSFVLPSGVDAVRGLVTFQRQHSDALLLLVGHTDTAGTPDYNDPLSLERARTTAAYLMGSVDDWMAWYDSGIAAEKRWGKREDLAMIDALPEAAAREVSENPIRWFQRTRGLDQDGIAGEQTRRVLIAEYMALDGTSLSADVPLVTHGCGESFPVDNTADGVADLSNRRVEAFFFDRKLGVQPPPPGNISKAGSLQYPDWLARAGKAVDFTAADQQVELVIEWPEDLIDLLDEDAAVVLAGDDVAPRKNLLGMAERTEGLVRVSFGELAPEHRVSLTAKQGDRELALFTDQRVGDLDDPLAWDHDLSELLLARDVANDELTAVEDMPEDGTIDVAEADV